MFIWRKKYLQKALSGLIAVSIITMPFFSFTPDAFAQLAGTTGGTGGYSAGTGVFGGSGGGIDGYLKGLAPTILKLPGCKQIFKGAEDSIFKTIKNVFGGKKKKPTDSSNPIGGGKDSGASTSDAIEVVLVKSQGKDLSNTAGNTGSTADATGETNKNVTCLKSIGKLVSKLLLQKITLSTIDWINGGFDGSPSYISNGNKFFSDIASNEILQFGIEVNNPSLFPFGKDFMKSQALYAKNMFAQRAQYSLDALIARTTPQYTGADFKANFSMGGWNAWDAMTQIPANNPFGFQLQASNELQDRLVGTKTSTAVSAQLEVNAGQGFMNQKVCVDPEGVTKEESDQALKDGDETGVCKKWQTVTPGSLLHDAAGKAFNYQADAVEGIDDFNGAVAAILDAVLAHYSSELYDKGIAGISTNGSSSTYSNEGNGYASLTSPSQTEMDFADSLSSSWLSNNPDFNIRTDLNQALIDAQRTYIQKLQQQNIELSSKKIVLGNTWNYGLIPIIYQLDYCIPGPHPGWQDDAQEALDKLEDKDHIIDTSGLDFLQISSKTDTGIPGGSNGTVSDALSGVSGALSNLDISGLLTTNNVDSIVHAARGYTLSGATSRRYYAESVIQPFTGLNIRQGGDSGDVSPLYDGTVESYDQTLEILDTLFSRYIAKIKEFFPADKMPAVTGEAMAEFNKIPSYNQLISDNTDKINTQKSIIIRLTTIKNAVDTLNTTRDNDITALGTNPPAAAVQTVIDTYETNLLPWINAFGRLSKDLVDGDDIANADSTLQAIKDKERYIYGDLLKGASGCENDSGTLDIRIKNGRRYSYPYPIIYDYNNYFGTTLPDPFDVLLGGTYTVNTAPTPLNPTRWGLYFVGYGGGGSFGSTGSDPTIDITDKTNGNNAGAYEVNTFEAHLGIY